MTKGHQEQASIQVSLPQTGENHQASFERSYNSDETIYTNARILREKWGSFSQQSVKYGRRRALMRCYISREILNQLSDIPIEAAVPLGNEYLIWIGENQHRNVSLQRAIEPLPKSSETSLPVELTLDKQVGSTDISSLFKLWEQFGSPWEGVKTFVKKNVNPIVVIRNIEQQAIGVMIAEAMHFGHWQLVELTELAVDPEYRGQGLANILIRELSRLSLDYYGAKSLLFGEYNLTTKSFKAASRSGHLPAQTRVIDGVLRDHVAIETGQGNQIIKPWDTRWLHNFLVMYQFAENIS